MKHHLAGTVVRMGKHVIQRCLICGEVLVEIPDLDRIAVAMPAPEVALAFWELGALVEVDGNRSSLVRKTESPWFDDPDAEPLLCVHSLLVQMGEKRVIDLSDGSARITSTCTCGACGNEFFVLGDGKNAPKCCCYCGVSFSKVTREVHTLKCIGCGYCCGAPFDVGDKCPMCDNAYLVDSETSPDM